MFSLFQSRKKPVASAKNENGDPQKPERKMDYQHFVNERSLHAPFPEGAEEICFGMGCFWGAEKIFWPINNVWVTMVGYGGGHTENPSYEQVCTGRTGHNELVRVIYLPEDGTLDTLLRAFWENHDPTQGMRQGNDRGTQYRSGIYPANEAQKAKALASRTKYQTVIHGQGLDNITTEIQPISAFYYAEEYHQQYLAKNPTGYCGLGGLGVACDFSS